VKRVNEAIDGGNAEETLAALKQSALNLQEVDDAGAFMYQEMLKAAKDAAKKNVSLKGDTKMGIVTFGSKLLFSILLFCLCERFIVLKMTPRRLLSFDLSRF
jgi:hypothetical protein